MYVDNFLLVAKNMCFFNLEISLSFFPFDSFLQYDSKKKTLSQWTVPEFCDI
jgi:hypothetical protein